MTGDPRHAPHPAGYRTAFTARGLTEAAGLVAAVRFGLDRGLFSLLREPMTPDTVAERISLPVLSVTILLQRCAAAGVLACDTDGRFSVRHSAEGLAFALDRWAALPDSLTGDADDVDSAIAYATLAPLFPALMDTACSPALELLRGRGPHLLDVGAGHAPLSRQLAADDHDLRVTAVDRPEVLHALALSLGPLRDQFKLYEADLRTQVLPRGFDVAILTGVLRLFAPQTAADLVRRVAASLDPGGIMVVLDAVSPETGSWDQRLAAYALDLRLRRPTGGPMSFSALASWCAGAGLVDVTRLSTDNPVLSIVHAAAPT